MRPWRAPSPHLTSLGFVDLSYRRCRWRGGLCPQGSCGARCQPGSQPPPKPQAKQNPRASMWGSSPLSILRSCSERRKQRWRNESSKQAGEVRAGHRKAVSYQPEALRCQQRSRSFSSWRLPRRGSDLCGLGPWTVGVGVTRDFRRPSRQQGGPGETADKRVWQEGRGGGRAWFSLAGQAF